ATGVGAAAVEEQLAPYLHHRRTGRPWVVLKLASTLDGRIAAPDGSSRWITGEEARADAHRLRAESDAVAVGAGTVRTDDPQLTVRLVPSERQPLRVVLGSAPESAALRPALELGGPLPEVLAELAGRGVMQLLVEGGSRVAHAFHSARLVDRYVLYLAPRLLGGSDGVPLFGGPGAATIAQAWQGEIAGCARLGPDLRVDLVPAGSVNPACSPA
ncbi:MAG: RibD family protein, partial [Acidimicrobiales bacterium]